MSRAAQLRVSDYLCHIIDAIERINRYVGSMDEEEFLGEASRNIERHHPDFAARHAEVPWGIAYEMRNALAHGYFMVDMEIVWKTIQSDLQGMAVQVSQLTGSQPEG